MALILDLQRVSCFRRLNQGIFPIKFAESAKLKPCLSRLAIRFGFIPDKDRELKNYIKLENQPRAQSAISSVAMACGGGTRQPSG